MYSTFLPSHYDPSKKDPTGLAFFESIEDNLKDLLPLLMKESLNAVGYDEASAFWASEKESDIEMIGYEISELFKRLYRSKSRFWPDELHQEIIAHMKSVCGEDIDRYKVPEKYMDIIRFYRDFCLFEYIQKLQQFRDDLFGVTDEEEESGVGNN